MIPLRDPLFRWGQKVCAAIDLANDGSHPGFAEGAVIARAGTPGEIINIGHHTESNTPVYLVEFDGQHVVGCLEEELAERGEG